jgi:hypothetical protein
MLTFAQRVRNAERAAIKKSGPFMPSMMQKMDELQPLIDDLLLMAPDEAKEYVRETFRHIGLESIAFSMYRNQLRNKNVV